MANLVRFFQKKDRAAVRKICADTGFLSKPIDPVFEDRELFADYLTQYYTDLEPESTLVFEMDGEVKGYLMGCRRYRFNDFYHLFHNAKLVFLGLYRYFFKPYNEASRKFIRWLIFRGWREVPKSPKKMAHFHINLLPEARKLTHAHQMIQGFINYLVAQGEKGVYGQMVVFEGRRGERMFARFGFEVLDKVEVTKYREVYPEKVYLFTIYKDLTRNSQLYGASLKAEIEPLS
ncbi:MAG: GNAT family acetyltransferase [Verrucomicrobiota bacterium]